MTIRVELPTLHADQVKAFRLPGRRKVVRCGRRWGKSTLGQVIAAYGAIGSTAGGGRNVGYFTPTYKLQSEIFNDLARLLRPVKLASSKVEGVIRTTTGGRIDFWTLENEDAGRSRNYHTVIIDEAAFTKPNMMGIWERSIEPTLVDHQGTAYVLSNTNGSDPDNFLFQICNEAKFGFKEHHAPTQNNPNMPLQRRGESGADYLIRREAEFAAIKSRRHPLVYRQEYLAEFVSWRGTPLFAEASLLVNGAGIAYPTMCESIFAIIDSSVKSGKEHDGTAVTYWAWSPNFGTPLICLDYDIVSIDGAMLEAWIPGVFARGEELARLCHARSGFTGTEIEDAASGSILLQQCAMRNWPANALPATLTAAGKDLRALNAANPVFRGEVKFSDYAIKKLVTFKENERNHLWTQVTGFRMGDKAAATRADDLLDTFCYAVAITLGGQEGIA